MNTMTPLGVDIKDVVVKPGMLFECKVLTDCTKNNSVYQQSSGLVMVDKHDRYFLMLLCYKEFDTDYDPTIGLWYDDFKYLTLYGHSWYLHFDKYPDNFGLSPKLFVVTDIIWGGRLLYESNCDLYNIDNSIKKNYVYTPTLNCKCFKIQKYGRTFTTDTPEKQLIRLKLQNSV